MPHKLHRGEGRALRGRGGPPTRPPDRAQGLGTVGRRASERAVTATVPGRPSSSGPAAECSRRQLIRVEREAKVKKIQGVLLRAF